MSTVVPETKRGKPIIITYGNPTPVLVQDGDGHLMPTSQHDLVLSYRENEDRKHQLANQQDALQWLVRSWFQLNRDRIQGAYLAQKKDNETSWMFLVVTKDAKHDPALQESLANLEIQVVDHDEPKLDLISFATLAVPAFGTAAVEAFLPEALQQEK